jgi:hypothetical protein
MRFRAGFDLPGARGGGGRTLTAGSMAAIVRPGGRTGIARTPHGVGEGASRPQPLGYFGGESIAEFGFDLWHCAA